MDAPRAMYQYTTKTWPKVCEQWWVTLENGQSHPVEISYDQSWFSQKGSMNDLKNMAIDAAREREKCPN